MRHEIIIRIVLIVGLLMAIMVDAIVSKPQLGIIRGEVLSTGEAQPIAKAVVRLEPTGFSAVTDNRGRFEFLNVAPGQYAINVSHPDFATDLMNNLVVRSGETIEVQIRLRPQTTPTDADSSSTEQSLKDSAVGNQQKGTTGDILTRPAPDVLSGATIDAFSKKARNLSGNYRDEVHLPPPEPDHVYVAPPPYDMFFRDYSTNRFVRTDQDRFSTFGIDVDDASFSLARQYLLDGHLPPAEAIRVEEFVNHFDYDYAAPADGRFRVFAEVTASPFNENTLFMKIGVKAKEIAEERRKPLNLTIVVDVSGSMGYDNRIDLLKKSLDLLLEQLDSGDRVGVVAYGSHAFVVLEPTPADRLEAIRRAIHRLHPDGSTYAEAGLKLGYQMANQQMETGHSNLIILCSDGVANVGQTSPDAIMRDIKRFSQNGITLSTFGVGMGNYNDVLLEQLAQKGNGRYAYVNDLEQARKLFVENVIGTLQLVARDVKIQVEFNPSTVTSYRLLGYENRAIPDQKFRDNRQDGGEVGSGHEVTALYEVIPNRGARSDYLATVYVRWKNPNETRVTEVSRTVAMDHKPMRFAGARPELRLAVVAAKFAEMLKETKYTTGINYTELGALAQSIDRQLHNEQTRALVSLIDRADRLSGRLSDRRRYDNNYNDNYDDDDDDD